MFLFSLYDSIFFALCTKANVEHVEQNFDWDCGHSCLKMVIQYCDNIDADRTDMDEDLATLIQLQKPLWTVDLFAYLLRHGISASFHTLCASGVTSQHESIEWYQSTSLVDDACRVKQLFQLAAEEQWPVYEVHTRTTLGYYCHYYCCCDIKNRYYPLLILFTTVLYIHITYD